MRKFAILLFIATLASCYYRTELINQCSFGNVSYKADIQPIMKTHCTGCHNGPSAAAGISLENYDVLKPFVNNGRLYGSMNHDVGYSPMPKGGNKIDSCKLAKVKSWVDAGAPNN